MAQQRFTCDACPNEVLVEKRSLAHTSTQWLRPTSCCPELAGRPEGTVAVCTRLRASIERAVRAGAVPVGGEDE
ncbi:hypothetical protein [Streptomyces sp. NPDC048659]|uniref:hypothetical protein n=1 Tax=Streptomyces sp. NPDC048659 TaxID=3155489 RepID=UPI0034383C09